jgi:hypothetical protein
VPAAFGNFIAAETEKWAKVVKVNRGRSGASPLFPGAAQHHLVVRCKPGIVPGSAFRRSRLCGAPLRKSYALHRVRDKNEGPSIKGQRHLRGQLISRIALTHFPIDNSTMGHATRARVI